MFQDQKQKNEKTLEADRRKIELLGGPITHPEKPTPGIWESDYYSGEYKTRLRSVKTGELR